MVPINSFSSYGGVLLQPAASAATGVTRDVCSDDDKLADALAAVLKAHPARPPKNPPKLNKALQGNLTEFGAWELGENHWFLFQRPMTWPSNADSPWKDSSSDGIDLMAIVADGGPALLVVEVKSSINNGTGLITGSGSSLQSDFNRLFSGGVQDRFQVAIGSVLSRLHFQGQVDLEEQVKGMIGASPAECKAVKLLGILFCKEGSTKDVDARERAFGRLANTLNSAGWRTDQISFRTVEVQDLEKFLDRTIAEATR